jgi:hypothetical protein
LSAVSKRMAGFRTNLASNLNAAHPASPFVKTPKTKRDAAPRAGASPGM